MHNLQRFYVFVDESGRVTDKYYTVTAFATPRKLRPPDLFELSYANDDIMRDIMRNIFDQLEEEGEVKGFLVLKEVLESGDEKRKAFINWLISVLKGQTTIRVAVIDTQKYYDLTREVLTSGLSAMIRAALLFRKNEEEGINELTSFIENNYGILHYLSSLSLEGVVQWLLNLKVPREKRKKRKRSEQEENEQIKKKTDPHTFKAFNTRY